jgi:hypothetical protein
MDIPDLNKIGDKVKHWQKEETSYFRALPLKNYVLSALAFLGLITTFLPWAEVTVGFFAKATDVGLHFFFGWLIFLVFAGVIGILLFNNYIKLQEALIQKIPLWSALASVGLSVGFIIGRVFDVQYGSYLCLAFSVIFLLAVMFYDKIIRGKQTTQF